MNYLYADFIRHADHRSLDILGLSKMDAIAFSENYFKSKLSSLSIDPNANVGGISPNNYLCEMAKPYAKYYFFKKLYEKGRQIIGDDFDLESVWDGSIYVHDATKIQPYCFGLSATEIATLGRPYASLVALPPKRLESFMGQLTEFIMDCSQEFAGAIAVTDLVPWMAWFIEKGKGRDLLDVTWVRDTDMDEDDIPGYVMDNYYSHQKELGGYTDKEIENIFQSFIHVLNNSFRVGGDSPFTNISVNSKKVYDDIFEQYTFPDGKTIHTMWETIKRVQKIIVEFMARGRPDGIPYRFPILTANFKSDPEEMKSDWFTYVAEKNCKGFMNVNFAERFAMCCRLNLDFDFKQNSFGGGGVKVGSMRVANLNLPRLAYKSITEYYDSGMSDTKKSFFLRNIREYTEEAMNILRAYSEVFKELIQMGYLKFFKEPSKWFTDKMFFATVGFCGIWDAVEILYEDEDVDMSKYVDVMESAVEYMVDKTKRASNGLKYNVEEVPSESAAGTMARFNEDYGETRQFYSNQFVPLAVDIPLSQRIDIEAKLQSKLTGGGMTFLNFDAPLTPEQSTFIHKLLMEKKFIGQFCINYGFTKCNSCTKVVYKDVKTCTVCGSTDVDYYTRVVGYLAKRDDACESKQLEIDQRQYYKMTT